MIVGAACQKGIHSRCPQKLGSGIVCECDCHSARKGYGRNEGNTVFCHLCDWSKFCVRGMEEIEASLQAHLREKHGKPLLYRVDDEGKRTDIP